MRIALEASPVNLLNLGEYLAVQLEVVRDSVDIQDFRWTEDFFCEALRKRMLGERQVG